MYGVIDIGSNTIRLMVYRVEDGAIHPVLNKKYATGLVGYINSKGRMSKEGIRKAVEILSELRAVTQQIRLREIFPFATASLRNITNTEEVLQAIQEASGFSVGSCPARRKPPLTTTAPSRARRRTPACWPTWAAAARSWYSSGTGR